MQGLADIPLDSLVFARLLLEPSVRASPLDHITYPHMSSCVRGVRQTTARQAMSNEHSELYAFTCVRARGHAIRLQSDRCTRTRVPSVAGAAHHTSVPT